MLESVPETAATSPGTAWCINQCEEKGLHQVRESQVHGRVQQERYPQGRPPRPLQTMRTRTSSRILPPQPNPVQASSQGPAGTSPRTPSGGHPGYKENGLCVLRRDGALRLGLSSRHPGETRRESVRQLLGGRKRAFQVCRGLRELPPQNTRRVTVRLDDDAVEVSGRPSRANRPTTLAAARQLSPSMSHSSTQSRRVGRVNPCADNDGKVHSS